MNILTQYPKEALFYFISEVNLKTTSCPARTKKELLKWIDGQPGLSGKIKKFIAATPIFRDAQFIDCWNAAFPQDGTVCLKTSFGACAYDSNGMLIASANNKRIGACLGIEAPFCSEDAGCIRQRMSSRTDQTVGECNHSIVWLLSYLFDRGLKPSTLSSVRVYEAGFLVDQGLRPWWRKVENYTCLYCVRIFLTFGLKTVYGAVGEKEYARWRVLSVAKDYQELAKQEVAQSKRQ